ncbi:MAG: PilZ domain-containing protein [Phycisphaerae bacterium]
MNEIGNLELLEASRKLIQNVNQQSDYQGSQRSVERRPWCMPLKIKILESTGRDAALNRTMIVATYDISQGGFSFLSRGYLHIGTTVVASFKELDIAPSISGVVRYCIHVVNTMHRVGVQFTDVERS